MAKKRINDRIDFATDASKSDPKTTGVVDRTSSKRNKRILSKVGAQNGSNEISIPLDDLNREPPITKRPKPPPFKPTTPAVSIKEVLKEHFMFHEASEMAAALSEKYGVIVETIRKDKDFYSDALIEESVKAKKYYVSDENPQVTAQITEFLIRYQLERDKEAQERKLELLGIANEKRVEKATNTAQELSPKIAEIITDYRASHNGKEPSLHKIAEILNEANIPSPRGQAKWYAQSVKRILHSNKNPQLGD